MQESFTIRQDVTLREWYALALYYLFKGKMIRTALIALTLLPAVAMLLPSLISGIKPDSSVLTTFLIPPLSLFTFITLGMLIGGPYIQRFKPQLVKGVILHFNHWGMQMESSEKESEIPWREFRPLRESKNFYWLQGRKNRNILIAVQKRSFTSETERSAFKTFVAQNIET